MDIRSQVVQALTQFLSKVAAERMLNRLLEGKNPSPSEWADLIEGPLMRDLGQVLPVKGPFGPFLGILQKLRAQVQPEAESEAVSEWVVLSSPSQRHALALQLARLSDVQGVIVYHPEGQEVRFPGLSPQTKSIFEMSHRLLMMRKPYSLFYTVFNGAQLVFRPINSGWIAVMARSEANLGHLLYRLRRIEALPEETLGG